MSDDILLELETVGTATGNLENISDLVRVVRRELDAAVEAMKGSAYVFEKAWQHFIVEVARGNTASVQAARGRFLRAFEKRLSLLEEMRARADWLLSFGAPYGNHSDLLLAEIGGLQHLRARVLDQWSSAEDLEELAAKEYPLNTADLDRIGSQRKPPNSYYVADSKPF
jgi:hypothetical protein